MDLVTPELRNATARSGRYAETEDKASDLDKAATYHNLRFHAGGDGFNADYKADNNDNTIGEGVNNNAATEVTESNNNSKPVKKKARVNIGKAYNYPCGCSKKIPTGFLS